MKFRNKTKKSKVHSPRTKNQDKQTGEVVIVKPGSLRVCGRLPGK